MRSKSSSGTARAAAAVAAVLGWSSPSTSQAKVHDACELLTASEIAQALKVPAVKKDQLNSGMHVSGSVDICNWYINENAPGGLEIRWYRASGGDTEPLAEYSAAKGDAFEHDSRRTQQAQSVPGLGVEALYGPWPDNRGGSVALRGRDGAVALSGSATREALLALARLIVSRM